MTKAERGPRLVHVEQSLSARISAVTNRASSGSIPV